MGLSTKKQTTTTTPIVSEPMNMNYNELANLTSNFVKSDPSQYVAPASPLQQKAFDAVQNGGLGGWQEPQQQALSMAQNAGGAGASTYQAPQLGQAGQAQGVNIAAAPQAQAQSLLTNLNAYMNPYTKDVVDASMADWDAQFGRMSADLEAKGAGAGAFAGSRFGVREGIFGGEALRGRGALNANLRADAFNTGAALSGQDADRRQSTSFFNIGNEQQRNLTQAGLDSTRNMFNTGAQNQFDLAQGGMDAQAAQYNAAAQEAQYQRALEAAGLTANIGSNMGAQSRADLGLTADLGQYQYLIDQARLNAVPTQLQVAGGLYGAIPQASYIGQKGVTKQSGGLGVPLLGAGLSALSSLIPSIGVGGGSTGPFGMKM